MNTLPYELIVNILKYGNRMNNFKFFRSLKLFKIMRLFFNYDKNKLVVNSLDDGSKLIMHNSEIDKSAMYIKHLQVITKIPRRITYVTYDWLAIMDINDLPVHITHLHLQYISKNIINLPEQLVYLKLGWQYDQKYIIFPSNLRYLIFHDNYSNEVTNLPSKLIYLKFGTYYNNIITNYPPKLIVLIFGYCFNQRIANLPDSLKLLKFGFMFNQKLYRLPNNLKYLSVGVLFKTKLGDKNSKTYWKSLEYIQLPRFVPNTISKKYQFIKDIPDHIKIFHIEGW